jgi:hypothetical protein
VESHVRACGLTAIYNPKFLRIGTPGEVVNRALLIKSNAAVKVTRGAKKVKSRLPVITFVGAVDICLRQDEDQSAKVIPFDLGLFCLEKRFLAGRWGAQIVQRVYVNSRWLAFFFGHEDRNGRVEAWTERDAGCSVDLESVNDALSPFCGVEHMNLLAYETDGVGF